MTTGTHKYTIAACRSLTNEECKISAETLASAAYRKSSLRGLNAKLTELYNLRDKEISAPKPDTELIKRIEMKISEIKETFKRCTTK